MIGAGAATATATATGGIVGAGPGRGSGGAAIADARATTNSKSGADAIAIATATGGETSSGFTAGAAAATAIALNPASLVYEVIASFPSAELDTRTESLEAIANIGGKAPPSASRDQSVAFVIGAPGAHGVERELKPDVNITKDFGPSPLFLGVGELGGGFGEHSLEMQDRIDLNLADVKTREPLYLGLFKGSASTSGVTGVTLSVKGNGVDILKTESFGSGQAAADGFTDQVFDIATLSGHSTGALDLTVNLTVDTNKASGFFTGDFILFGGSPSAASALSEALAPPSSAMWRPHS
jgi:hypothetical protein